MSRTKVPLSDAACRLAKPTERTYKPFDGDGLYLLGRKGWRLRYVKPDGWGRTDLVRQLPRHWPRRCAPQALGGQALAVKWH